MEKGVKVNSKTEGGKEGREANQGVEAWLSSHTTSDFSGGYIDIETPDTQGSLNFEKSIATWQRNLVACSRWCTLTGHPRSRTTRIPKDLWGRAQGCVSRDADPWCPRGPAGLLQPWRRSPRQGLSLRKGGAKTSVPSEAQRHGERGGTKDAYVRAREVHLLGTKSSHFSSPRWQRKWMEDPSVKGHQSLGSNPPSAYQCYRVY